jgi:hypothetical protein
MIQFQIVYYDSCHHIQLNNFLQFKFQSLPSNSVGGWEEPKGVEHPGFMYRKLASWEKFQFSSYSWCLKSLRIRYTEYLFMY